jgi:hypothetical protein
MKNDTPLRWNLKLTADLARGECAEYVVTGRGRGAEVALRVLGLSIAEGKAILATIQTRRLEAQIECHEEVRRFCARCARRLPNEARQPQLCASLL